MGIARGAVTGAAAGAAFGPIGAGIGGVVGGIGGYLSGRGKDKAEDEEFRARSEQFGQDERSRIWRNQASQALLRSLFGGRYAIPEDTFANFQEERPYTGADPGEGRTFSRIGEEIGDVADIGLDARALAGRGGGGVEAYPAAPSVSATGEVTGVSFDDPYTRDEIS